MSAIKLAGARSAIVTILSGVSGIGQVHNRIRPVFNEADVNFYCCSPAPAAYGQPLPSGSRINVWMVTLADSEPYITIGPTGNPGRYPLNYEQAYYQFSLHGWYSASDAPSSETAFADLVEAVIAAFRANKKLEAGGAAKVIDSGPAQWYDAGFRKLPPGDGGTVCHYARVGVRVREQTEP